MRLLPARHGHAWLNVAHGHPEHAVLGDHVGVVAGRAVVARATDADVGHAGLPRLGDGDLHRPAGDRRRHAVLGVDDRPRGSLGDDLFLRVGHQAAAAGVLHQPTDLPRAVGEGAPGVGGDEHAGRKLRVRLAESRPAHRFDAERLQRLGSNLHCCHRFIVLPSTRMDGWYAPAPTEGTPLQREGGQGSASMYRTAYTWVRWARRG